MQPMKVIFGSTKLMFLYCLPAIFAICTVLGSYYKRTENVVDYIETQRQEVESAFIKIGKPTDSPSKTEEGKEESEKEQLNPFPEFDVGHKNLVREALGYKVLPEQQKQLVDYFIEQHVASVLTKCKEYAAEDGSSKKTNNKDNECIEKTSISKEITSVWISNSIKVAILAIFPFLLLGTHLGFSPKLPASYQVRRSVVHKNWWIKFLIGLILAYGWVYVINPAGRGTGTIAQFLTSVDLSTDSLPAFLKGGILHPIIAGFLGWYLYMLTYYFSKVYTHDVLSSNSYGLMFQKFLFTYGVAIVILPAMQATNVESTVAAEFNTINAVAFFVGFFPMSAFSLLKDSGLKILHGAQTEKGQLQELPGISRWQILRLEEEGIDSMGALAAFGKPEELQQNIPAMGNLIYYWIDIARLYTVLGQEAYLKVRKHCRTASELVLKSQDASFVQLLDKENAINPLETARILQSAFPDSLSYSKK